MDKILKAINYELLYYPGLVTLYGLNGNLPLYRFWGSGY